MSVTLYSTPSCGPCRGLEGSFKRAGIAFTKVNLALPTNAELVASLKARGLTQTPIVIAGDIEFSGMQPDKIEKVISLYRTTAE
ncbi:glutaredoxin family protein [Glutamicibacter arilaitensis]|uniref:glutaredoxin family protein n=1 Tax=Glutamicibacter arilaitensis TaxID=256701 RepID=UPI003F9033FD